MDRESANLFKILSWALIGLVLWWRNRKKVGNTKKQEPPLVKPPEERPMIISNQVVKRVRPVTAKPEPLPVELDVVFNRSSLDDDDQGWDDEIAATDPEETPIEPVIVQKDSSQPINRQRELLEQRELARVVLKKVLSRTDNLLIHDASPDFMFEFVKQFTHGTKDACAVLSQHGDLAFLLDGCRIHDFFRFPDDTLLLNQRSLQRTRLRETFQNIEVFIIAGIEDVRPDTLDAMDWCLRKTLDTNEPFGGKRVLLIGNALGAQRLTSQDDTQRLFQNYNGTEYYYSPSFDSGGFSIVKTTTAPRMESKIDSALLDRLSMLRASADDVALITLRATNRDTPSITVVGTRRIASVVNHNEVAGLNRKGIPFIAESSMDSYPEYSTPSPRELLLCQGARVLFVADHPTKLWHRGSTGTVMDVKSGVVQVLLDGGLLVTVEPTEWTQYTWEFDALNHSIVRKQAYRYKQLPLTLGYAIAIGDVRQMELASAQFDFQDGRPTATGELYQALRAFRSLGNISMTTPLRETDCVSTPKALSFFESLF